MITQKAQEERTAAGNAPDLSGLSLQSAPKVPPTRPPRPAAPVRKASSVTSEEEDDDDDNPFGDKNVISTPAAERAEPHW